MSRRGKGGIGPEDRALWARVQATVTPLPRPVAKKAPKRLENPADDPAPSGQPRAPIAPFQIGQSAAETSAPAVTGRTRAPNIDKRIGARLRRGKLKPEARIDLHGMTQDRAHRALTGFILRAHQDGLRLVLVITGKGQRADPAGDPFRARPGVLRRNVPEWLKSGALGQVVQEVLESHQSHGGAGALYVYLRRRR